MAIHPACGCQHSPVLHTPEEGNSYEFPAHPPWHPLTTEIDRGYCQLLTHGVKQGGLAICNLVDTAPSVHSASIAATRHVTVSFVDSRTQFDLGAHRHCATKAGQVARKSRLPNEWLFLDCRGWDNPSVARQDNWNCVAGAWLSVFPNWLNGTGLLADEWRDNVRLRYNHSPLDMPAACNGCGAKMSVENSLLCKVDSFVHIQHDDVADEWRHLCSTALFPSQGERKPQIFTCVSQRARAAEGNTNPPHHQLLLQTHLQHHPQPPGKGVTRAAMGSGNVAGHAYSICMSQTRMPGPIIRKNLGKFFCSTRRRRKMNTFRPVWRCGRTLHLWYIWLMELRDARPRMPRRGLPPTWKASETVDIPRWCIM
jgi:hypothetical protein